MDDHESFDLIRVLLEVCIDNHEANLIILVISIILFNLLENHAQHDHRGNDRQQPDVFERVDPILEPTEKALVEGPQPDEQLHYIYFRVLLSDSVILRFFAGK